MRRFFTIIFILIIIVAIVLGILWLGARKTATQNNAPKPTFREFVTGSTKQGQGTEAPGGTLNSSFDEGASGQTPPGQPTSPGALTPGQTPPIDGSLSAPGTQTSTFTNDTLIPTSPSSTTTGTNSPTSNTPPGTTPTPGGTLVADIDPNAGTTPGTPTPPSNTPPGTTPTPGGTVPPPPTPPSGPNTPAPQCSDADVNIVFTPEELADIKTLERRFYTIAESIRTDEDIAREVTNHDTFKLKGDEILELYNYCAQKSPRLTQTTYQRRVPTPFWNDTTTDRAGFFTEANNREQSLTIAFPDDFIINMLKRRLEYGLKLNLW